MQLLDTFISKYDKTVKFVFLTDRPPLILEATYIDNGSGKDIICIATQSSCNMGCKFCHLTNAVGPSKRIPVVNFSTKDMIEAVTVVNQKMNLATNNRTLLVSFMGCGEPLRNSNVLAVMRDLQAAPTHQSIRFGLATSLPAVQPTTLFEWSEIIKRYNIPLKVHLSLHFTEDRVRKEWMPSALDIGPSICALEYYHKYTGNSVEVHYSLIDHVNNRKEDLDRLVCLLDKRDIPVKFMRFNEKPDLAYKASTDKDILRLLSAGLDQHGICNEYYEPPGIDVGASCGQFLMDYYKQYNLKAI